MNAKISGISRYNWIFVVLCILGHTWVWHLHSKTSSDQLYQTAGAMSLVSGHGVAIPYADDADPAVWQYRKIESWPAGYSVMAALYLLVTGRDAYLSGLLVAISGFILLFFSLYKILRAFESSMQPYAIPLIFLFWTFAYAPFRHLGPSDVVALALLASGVSLVFYYNRVKQSAGKGFRVFLVLLIGLLAFGTCFVRYAYYPHAMIFFLVFFAVNYLCDKRMTRENVLGSLLILALNAILIALQMSGQNYNPDMLGEFANRNVSNPVESWALLYAPFFNAFFSDHFVYSFFMKIMGTKVIPLALFIIIAMISLFLCVILITGVVSFLKRFFLFASSESACYFVGKTGIAGIFVVSAITIAVNLGFFMLVFYGQPLDIKNDLLAEGGLYAQFTVASRYYAPAFLFIQLTAFIIVFAEFFRGQAVRKMMTVFFFLALLVNVILWGYLRSGLSLVSRNENMMSMNLPEGSYHDFELLNKLIRNEELPVVYSVNPQEKQRNYRQILSSQIACAAGAALGSFYPQGAGSLQSSGDVVLYVPLYDDDLKKEHVVSFMHANHASPLLEMKYCGFTVYRIELSPDRNAGQGRE